MSWKAARELAQACAVDVYLVDVEAIYISALNAGLRLGQDGPVLHVSADAQTLYACALLGLAPQFDAQTTGLNGCKTHRVVAVSDATERGGAAHGLPLVILPAEESPRLGHCASALRLIVKPVYSDL